MTFTEFIRSQHPRPKASFLALVRHDSDWPAQSDRLEDYEAFLLTHLEEESREVIPVLRDLWRDYAMETALSGGKHHLDLALAAWGDYARHLRTCTGTAMDPCATAEELLEHALDESEFEEHPSQASLPCEGMDAESDEGDPDDDEVDADLDLDDPDDWDTDEADEDRC